MMSLTPIWTFELAGNIALILISFFLLYNISRIIKLRPGTPLWMYLQWQVYALSVFALSHSTAHILRRVLLGMDKTELWNAISPYTGGINSVAFVVVGILSFLYKDIESAMERMGSLQEAKAELEFSISMLKESALQMEKDAGEIMQKNKELAVLNKISLSVSRSLELDKVLEAIVKAVREFLGADFLGIYMVEGPEVVLKVSEGMSDTFREKVASLDPEEPWLKRMVLAGKPLFRKEGSEEQAGRIDAGIKAEGIRAWAAIPLVAKDRALGILTVGSTRYDGLEQEQMDTLITIGSYAGVVIESSMLYEELRQKVNDLERFRKLSVGREMRIVELKERLKEMEGGKKAG